jgi:hypothetical protein
MEVAFLFENNLASRKYSPATFTNYDVFRLAISVGTSRKQLVTRPQGQEARIGAVEDDAAHSNLGYLSTVALCWSLQRFARSVFNEQWKNGRVKFRSFYFVIFGDFSHIFISFGKLQAAQPETPLYSKTLDHIESNFSTL